MTAQEILKLIEEVDPKDTAKLDEIDARVWCYLNNQDQESTEFGVPRWMYAVRSKPYTRSRDALKAIRPEGWRVFNLSEGDMFEFDLGKTNARVFRGQAITEELAELAAIIQAINYEINTKE